MILQNSHLIASVHGDRHMFQSSACQATQTFVHKLFTVTGTNFGGISELNSSSSCPPSVLASTAMIFAGLLLVPCVSTPLSSHSGVTSSTLHMIRIFSAVGFVFFFFQSLTVVSGMPVLFANSFCVISSSLILAKMRSLIVIIIFRLSGERHRWGYENRGAFALSAFLYS